MHADEIEIDETDVRRLLRAQHPQWAELPIKRIESTGTVNAIFRLGDAMSVRLPRTPRWHDIDAEVCWLRNLASRLPIAIPEPLVVGEPDEMYPWKWGVFAWLDAETWAIDRVAQPRDAATQLADFLKTLWRIDTASLRCTRPANLGSLSDKDHEVQAAATAASNMLDADAFLRAWEEALRAPAWDGPAGLVHGDILAANVLVHAGTLRAVIDWAGLHHGDPARDLAAAWTLFDRDTRRTFQSSFSFDENTWRRARGWALTRITGVAYYAETNPLFSADARATIARVLHDQSVS